MNSLFERHQNDPSIVDEDYDDEDEDIDMDLDNDDAKTKPNQREPVTLKRSHSVFLRLFTNQTGRYGVDDDSDKEEDEESQEWHKHFGPSELNSKLTHRTDLADFWQRFHSINYNAACVAAVGVKYHKWCFPAPYLPKDDDLFFGVVEDVSEINKEFVQKRSAVIAKWKKLTSSAGLVFGLSVKLTGALPMYYHTFKNAGPTLKDVKDWKPPSKHHPYRCYRNFTAMPSEECPWTDLMREMSWGFFFFFFFFVFFFFFFFFLFLFLFF